VSLISLSCGNIAYLGIYLGPRNVFSSKDAYFKLEASVGLFEWRQERWWKHFRQQLCGQAWQNATDFFINLSIIYLLYNTTSISSRQNMPLLHANIHRTWSTA